MSDIDDRDDGDDRYEEYKDNVAMGYINPDGSQREPDEPDWDQHAEEEHSYRVHGGGPCDCPEPPRRTLDLPHDFPRIVVLCGSTRFPAAFRKANLELTLTGAIVLSIGCDLRSAGDLAAAKESGLDPGQVKAALDELHKRKIDLADEVLVVGDAATGHIGQSTAAEIAYANSLSKPVIYMNDAVFDRADALGLVIKAPF